MPINRATADRISAGPDSRHAPLTAHERRMVESWMDGSFPGAIGD